MDLQNTISDTNSWGVLLFIITIFLLGFVAYLLIKVRRAVNGVMNIVTNKLNKVEVYNNNTQVPLNVPTKNEKLESIADCINKSKARIQSTVDNMTEVEKQQLRINDLVLTQVATIIVNDEINTSKTNLSIAENAIIEAIKNEIKKSL